MTLQKKLEVLSAAIVLAAAAGPAAADAGLGASFIDTSGANGATSGTTWMVPIRTGQFMIEPQLAWQDAKIGGNKVKTQSPGVGLYMTKSAGQLFDIYYGGIVAYNKSENAGVKDTSFSLIPTVGVAHYFSKQFSLGVDAGLEYTDGTRKTPGAADQDIKNIQTVTRIVVRGFFF
jgi:hypothetical protein